MKLPRIWSRFVGMVAIAASLGGCHRSAQFPSDPRDVIQLRWIPGSPGESRSDVETGLLWSLSLVGAALPEDADVITWHYHQLTLDLAQARVVPGTEPAWRELLAAMKSSGEYRAKGAIDVGRFVSLTLGSSNHYYALTGALADYERARARYRFDSRSAAIVTSAVAFGSRRIDLAEANRARDVAFVAFEGGGSLANGTFVAHEMELVDVMLNGQLRFALYDLAGHLKSSASPELTRAGKPAKCMWCHEAKLQTTFVDFRGARGFYDRREFDQQIVARRRILSEYRDSLDTKIRFRNLQDHTYAELLYVTFEEPSRERLASEWGLPLARIDELLRGKPTHAQSEYPKVGSRLYWREDVDGLAPYAALKAPESVREPSTYEPELIEVRR